MSNTGENNILESKNIHMSEHTVLYCCKYDLIYIGQDNSLLLLAKILYVFIYQTLKRNIYYKNAKILVSPIEKVFNVIIKTHFCIK